MQKPMQNEKAVFATKDNKGDGHFDMQKPMQNEKSATAAAAAFAKKSAYN